MPEKLRLGTPVVLLLVFGESFRIAMDRTIVQKDLKIRIILIHITDARRADYIDCAGGFLSPKNSQIRVVGVVLMSTLQRLAAITDVTADLIAQLHELDELREQIRRAELSAQRSPPINRRKITFNSERRRVPLGRLHR
jgi:hypothetical protein